MSHIEERLREKEEKLKVARSADEVNTVQLKSLAEEIKYVKQQFTNEIEGLRSDN